MYLFLFLLATVVLSTLPHDKQLAVATAVRASVLAPVLQLQRWFSDARAVHSQLDTLRRERDALARRLLTLEDVAEENLRLRALVGLAARGGQRFVPANLYPAGRGAELVKRSFVIDRGVETGIVDDAPVIAAGGLVGVVRIAVPGQSVGDFWTHRDFRVSAMTADGRVFGIIKPLSGVQPLMQLDGAPYQVELTRGTELVTSGMGGVFPRGIPVGQVIDVISTEEGWARSYRVEPAVYPDAIREVMVVISTADVDLSDAWPPGEGQ